ncbi:MAG: quinol:cytochrome C oxidoreductase [Bacteroidota bacterium]
MTTTTNTFELPGSYKKWTIGLIAAGIIALLYGVFMFHPWEVGHEGEHIQSTRFWSVLLQNSVFWLLVVNASMFFIGITTLAMGGWQVALRRVPEAISSVVPVLGLITFAILMAIVWGGRHDIYHWVDPQLYDKNSSLFDKILNGKKGFLNPGFFSIWSGITVLVWWFLGKKMRQLSLQSDKGGTMDYETGKRWVDKNFLYASLFIVFFGLTVGSTIPWLWLMSIDAHWYSTMYSWYTFASSFVSGLSLIAIFVVYLKNRGQLEYVTEEHLHDVGKFMFAFSVFWAYLWFSQYMLIWYANIPEETGYFKIRVQGPFRGIFFLNLILNFIAPLLILMKKGAKRNWTLLTVMAVLIIFGHWIDFWQMVMPGTLKEHAELMPFEFGIAALFIGIIMWRVGAYFTKHPLTAKNHPFLKESMIHHT